MINTLDRTSGDTASSTGAELSSANLNKDSSADLTKVRDDIWAVLSCAPAEAFAVRDALLAGKVEGWAYSGQCACLVGTIANERGCSVNDLLLLEPNMNRPAEIFFLSINQGDTPDNSESCKLAYQWVDQWIRNMQEVFGGGQAI